MMVAMSVCIGFGVEAVVKDIYSVRARFGESFIYATFNNNENKDHVYIYECDDKRVPIHREGKVSD
jgi:hypothetical protein